MRHARKAELARAGAGGYALGMIGRTAGGIGLGLALLASSLPAAAQDLSVPQLELLRATDLRLATIAYRLVTANAALCRDLQPAPGLVLHAIDQYPASLQPRVRSVFGFAAPVSVETVVPGSPAAAVLKPGDAITAIDGTAMPAPKPGNPSSATRDAAIAILAGEPADQPLTLTTLRDGKPMTVTIAGRAGCRSAFEVLLGPKLSASSDGRIVQIGVRFFEKYDDDQIAVVVAHELSHTILRHRARLEAAGVSWGVFGEFGKNGARFRRTEDDADLLGMYLMRNAGYDPHLAVKFWRTAGPDIDGGMFRSRTHGSANARAAAIEAEIARIPKDAPVPYLPPILATRDQPLN
jgi:hypothetical protein